MLNVILAIGALAFLSRFLGTNPTHDVFPYAIVNNRVDAPDENPQHTIPDGYSVGASAHVDTSFPDGVPRIVINVTRRVNWPDVIAHQVAHEVSHGVYQILLWSQRHSDRVATLDLSLDRTHDVDGGIAA